MLIIILSDVDKLIFKITFLPIKYSFYKKTLYAASFKKCQMSTKLLNENSEPMDVLSIHVIYLN